MEHHRSDRDTESKTGIGEAGHSCYPHGFDDDRPRPDDAVDGNAVADRSATPGTTGHVASTTISGVDAEHARATSDDSVRTGRQDRQERSGDPDQLGGHRETERDVSYLETLMSWTERETVKLDRDVVSSRWMSLPLPTRRFGPDCWAMSVMHVSPSKSEAGPFLAWVVLANEEPRLIAYLEQPLASTFGTIEPFSLTDPDLEPVDLSTISDLGLAGAAFFNREEALPAHAAIAATFLSQAGDDLAARLRTVAPDFFSWAERGESLEETRHES